MLLYTAAAKKITHLPTINIFHIVYYVYIGGSYIIILLCGSVCFIFNSVHASSWRSRWRTPLDFNYGSSNANFFYLF